MRWTTVEGLRQLRRDAWRRGVWYRLTQLERSVVELTVRYVDHIRSSRLALVLSRIVCKLLTALQSPFLRDAIRVGAQRAARISRLATAWGSSTAEEWLRDGGFIRFLGVIALNNAPGWSAPS